MQADMVVDEVAQRSGSFNLNTIPSEPAFNSLVFVSKLTTPGAFKVRGFAPAGVIGEGVFPCVEVFVPEWVAKNFML